MKHENDEASLARNATNTRNTVGLAVLYDVQHVADFHGPTKDEPLSKKTILREYLLSSLRVDTLIEIQLLLLTFSTGRQDTGCD